MSPSRRRPTTSAILISPRSSSWSCKIGRAFLKLAATIEGVGVAAYTGAAQYLIDNDDLLTAALTIHGVEARHASYLNVVTGQNPFPNAVDAPKTPDEILKIAGPFIKG
ncbi:MAG: hypothetical protein C4345_07770 [Chloroflexota bacterium]